MTTAHHPFYRKIAILASTVVVGLGLWLGFGLLFSSVTIECIAWGLVGFSIVPGSAFWVWGLRHKSQDLRNNLWMTRDGKLTEEAKLRNHANRLQHDGLVLRKMAMLLFLGMAGFGIGIALAGPVMVMDLMGWGMIGLSVTLAGTVMGAWYSSHQVDKINRKIISTMIGDLDQEYTADSIQMGQPTSVMSTNLSSSSFTQVTQPQTLRG